ncbi:MAG: protein kinase domain-containing protein [Thermomicrobiales bacterium]
MAGERFPARDTAPASIHQRPTGRLAFNGPAAGQVIAGRYELRELVGEGGAAYVYRAHDRVLDRPVALKLLRAEYGGDRDFVARFQREARAIAAVSHPNIVAVYDYGAHNGANYIVMQYVDGVDLKALLAREGHLSPRRTIAIADQVLAALAAAHAHGIIHRDVKPQNILVSRADGTVKLTDFGIARSLDGEQTTTAGVAFGTAAYMAPEQATGDAISPATDLYAVGVVLYECLTGQLPFAGDTPMQVVAQRLHAPAPPVRALAPATPAPLAAVFDRALARDPAARYPYAAAMRGVLVGIRLGPAPPGGPRAVTGVLSAHPARRQTASANGSLLPLAALLLLCLLLGLFGLTRVFADKRDAPTTPVAGVVATATTVPAAMPAVAATTVAPTPAPTSPPAPVVAPTQPPAKPTPAPTAKPAPTATPAPPPPAAPAGPANKPDNPGKGKGPKKEKNYDPYQLQGAYRRTDGVLYGLPEVALYGADTPYAAGTLTFTLDDIPDGAAALVLSGLDDERPDQCRLQVLLNNRVVFDGASTFPNTPDGDNGVGGPPRFWGDMQISLPAGVLKAGPNTLVLRNATPGKELGIPYMLIHGITLVEGES